MEPEESRSPLPAVPTRRELHGSGRRADRRRAEARRASGGRGLGPLPRRWAPRAAVLGVLTAATIAAPLLDGAPAEATPEAPVTTTVTGPSTYQVLSSAVQPAAPTSVLAAVPGARRVSGTVSRSLEREPLPGCDGLARTDGQNGQIPSSDLCVLWDPAHMLRGDAAVALTELNLNYRAAFGRNLCITDSYRPLSVQRRLAYTKPGLAATPGRSNHGWGLAVDLCASETGNPQVMSWMTDNGRTYGWVNPRWAQRGGSGPYEPWHWEYAPGTTSLGTNWDD